MSCVQYFWMILSFLKSEGNSIEYFKLSFCLNLNIWLHNRNLYSVVFSSVVFCDCQLPLFRTFYGRGPWQHTLNWRPPFWRFWRQFGIFSKHLALFLKCSAITSQNVHENCKQKKIFQNFFLILRFFSIFKWRERKISYRSLPASYFHWNKYLFGKFHSHSGQELHKSRNIRIDSQYFRHIFNMRLLGVTDIQKKF